MIVSRLFALRVTFSPLLSLCPSLSLPISLALALSPPPPFQLCKFKKGREGEKETVSPLYLRVIHFPLRWHIDGTCRIEGMLYLRSICSSEPFIEFLKPFRDDSERFNPFAAASFETTHTHTHTYVRARARAFPVFFPLFSSSNK